MSAPRMIPSAQNPDMTLCIASERKHGTLPRTCPSLHHPVVHCEPTIQLLDDPVRSQFGGARRTADRASNTCEFQTSELILRGPSSSSRSGSGGCPSAISNWFGRFGWAEWRCFSLSLRNCRSIVRRPSRSCPSFRFHQFHTWFKEMYFCHPRGRFLSSSMASFSSSDAIFHAVKGRKFPLHQSCNHMSDEFAVHNAIAKDSLCAELSSVAARKFVVQL